MAPDTLYNSKSISRSSLSASFASWAPKNGPTVKPEAPRPFARRSPL